MKKPVLYKVEKFKDHRGQLDFCNEFVLNKFVRFYVISSEIQGQIRAWQGHKIEEKAFFPILGKTKVILVPVLDFEKRISLDPIEFILDSNTPEILVIPGGYANGFQFLTDESKLMVYSNLKLEESKNDDFRFNSNEFYAWS
ncbi:WxcM-like domain-containing protein [Algoriphagus mannitolivorans]|uniref:WxcM-like domain-containing protein n=1 Tax=Algoriphagus mannitolivorans TaxID=226504 RepID=UPI000686DF09|nr:WxcM-like domain-containing protein [Algoriphagus mannitolivorans]